MRAPGCCSTSWDAGLGLRAGADDLGLDFIPLTWEHYDIASVRARSAPPGR
ncbi:MAG: hypothetical protein L0H64_01385 [Pseudonocardia sp.]|nr:hypothetical protein [Pseudonocardia sp.]